MSLKSCSLFKHIAVYILSFIATVWLLPAVVYAQNDVLQITSVSLDRPTLHTLGVQMLISGDANRNATVAVRYRPVGSTPWKDGPPLFRVFPETVAQPVPEQFAGSIFDLNPDTAYEIELHATDVDGPVNDVRTITGRTRPVPAANPATPRTVNVSTATELRSALANALPGDVIVIANGIYTGTFAITASGTASNPIVIRGQSDTGVILDGQNCASCNVLEPSGSYIHIENLTLRNAWRGIKFLGTGTLNNVVRRVQIKNVVHGMDGGTGYRDFYVCDNVIEGRNTWPDVVYAADASSHWDDRGVQVNGDGHVVCHNKISGMGDPILNKKELHRSFDVYGNDLLNNYDGLELDRSAGNVRAFHNRWTNLSNGTSFQPVNGGPAYMLRNVILNPRQQLKFAATGGEPSGMLVYHNTFVSPVRALNLQNIATSRNFKVMNNLFVGPLILSGRTVDWTGGISAAGKFDFNGYFPDGGFRLGTINGIDQLFPNFAALSISGLFEGGGTLLTEPIFAAGFVGPTDGTIPQNPADFALASASNAHDRGTVLPGINDSYIGIAPDLGALETGCPVPIYGPRPLGSEHLTSLIDCDLGPSPSDTTPPVISSVSVPFITSSGATITWTTNEASDSQVEYGSTTAYGNSTTLDPTLVTSHSATLSGLTAATLYHFRVKSRDAAGNLATSGDFTFTTLPPPDTTPPAVSMTSPLSGATVSGTITVSADASDNVGIAGVQFKLDGVNLQAEEKFLPYLISWDTTTASNGLHTITAVARDAAGNTTTSAPVTVTVANDLTPPTVSMTSPLSGTTVSGTITVSANASDNFGIAGVQFKLDGVNLQAEEKFLPYLISWDTTTASNGLHTITALARDTAGNSAVSTAATITISNVTAAPAMLTLKKRGSGKGTVTATGINCGTDCKEAYNSGTSETLTASPSNGSSFKGWSGGGCSGSNSCSVTVNADTTVTATFSKSFTDDPLTSQVTPIRAAHITESREAIDTLRSNDGLSTFSFTDSTISAGVTRVNAVHITELRTALNEVYDAQSKTRPTYTDATITAGQTTIKKAHIAEIRSNIKAVE